MSNLSLGSTQRIGDVSVCGLSVRLTEPVAMCDGIWSLLGTANVSFRSTH